MANLYAWQKLSRVLGGKPFGNGVSGDATLGADPNTRATASATSGTTSLTIGSTILSNNDIFLVHQSRGTGAGQWEFNRVFSGGGTSSITTLLPLNYSYASSGSDAAQVVKVPMYHDVTLNSFSPSSWNGSTGGIAVIAANGTLTVAGTVSTNGGSASGYSGGSGGGFYGGDGFYQAGGGHGAYCGEGTVGPKNAISDNRGNAGGGGYVGSDTGGGGGANASTGGTGSYGPGGQWAHGGSASGSADLITMTMGGGGGAGCSDDSYGGGGGAGAGIIFLLGKTITVTGGLTTNGGNGSGYTGDPWYSQACGGGGAGGSIILVTQTATLGTNKLVASAGSGGSQQWAQSGGSGSAGIIAVHYYRTVTGTTSPSYTGVIDPTLREASKMAQMMG